MRIKSSKAFPLDDVSAIEELIAKVRKQKGTDGTFTGKNTVNGKIASEPSSVTNLMGVDVSSDRQTLAAANKSMVNNDDYLLIVQNSN